jgi:hypothetical protein
MVQLKRCVVLLALFGACLGLSAPVRAQNILANPNFDDNGGSLDGWIGFGSQFPDTTVFLSAPGSAKLFGVGNPGFDASGLVQSFASTPGDTFQLDGSSYIDSGDAIAGANFAVFKIAFFDAPAGGNEIGSNEVNIGNSGSALDVWQDYSVIASAPPGTQRVEALILFLQPATDTGAIFVDNMSFQPIMPPPNLLINPNFDDAGGSLNGWIAFGNASADPNISLSAPASGKMFGNFSGGFDVTGIFQAFPATEADEYTMSASSFVGSFDPLSGTGPDDFNWAEMKIVFKDAGNAEIGANAVIIADGTVPQDEWRPFTVSATAPAGTASVEAFFLFLQPFNDGGSVFVDNATFSREASVACCDDNNTCTQLLPADCEAAGGRSAGEGSDCATTDCLTVPIPTVSEWGLLLMALLGLVVGTTMFRRKTAIG